MINQYHLVDSKPLMFSNPSRCILKDILKTSCNIFATTENKLILFDFWVKQGMGTEGSKGINREQVAGMLKDRSLLWQGGWIQMIYKKIFRGPLITL